MNLSMGNFLSTEEDRMIAQNYLFTLLYVHEPTNATDTGRSRPYGLG